MSEKQPLEKSSREIFYKCPACGQMVDNRQPEAVRLHHDHVLHPGFYFFAESLPLTRPTSR